MRTRIRLAVGAALLMPLAGLLAGEFTSLHPEEAHPDSTEKVSPHPYTAFIKRVQEKLHENGFDAGPVNGDFGTKTQAALVQFQLSRTIPASGQLDDETLSQLGVERAALLSTDPAAPAPRAPGEQRRERTGQPAVRRDG